MPKKTMRIGERDISYDDDPTIEDLLQTLDMYNFRPKMKVSNLEAGVNGAYLPRSNEIHIAPGAGTFNTVGHELQHSVDESMERSVKGFPKQRTPQQTQFTDGLAKLWAPSKLPGNSNNAYRNDPYEVRAHGVGNMTPGPSINPGRPHQDATMATEQAILRDLYRRAKTK